MNLDVVCFGATSLSPLYFCSAVSQSLSKGGIFYMLSSHFSVCACLFVHGCSLSPFNAESSVFSPLEPAIVLTY
jgi:hypothetical protein